MMKSVVLILVFVTSQAAVGWQESLANMHDQVIMKKMKKRCMKGHFHAGHGESWSKKEARQLAVENWINFTSFEYGDSWADWELSEEKKLSCSEGVFSEGWKCIVNSRPCRKLN